MKNKPLLYAHRGAAAQEPENTMQGFERAISYGAHGLEMDIHMTADGVVVVAHDPDGKRMCGQSAYISRTQYAELAGWDAGWGFTNADAERPFANRGYRIPRLEEVLAAFPQIRLNIDLKQSSPSMVHRVVSMVHAARAEDRVILASFSQLTLLHLRACGYRGLTGMGPAELVASLLTPRWMMRRAPMRGLAAQIPTHVKFLRFDTKATIHRLHQIGVRVDFWTINNIDEAKRLLDLGADGIMTDDPQAIAPLWNQPVTQRHLN